MYLLLATNEREVPTQLSRVPSGARHGGRFLLVFSEGEGEGDTPQFLPEVFVVEGSSSGGI
jgi:hypothetical protein